MSDQIRIRMFGGFSLFVNNECFDQAIVKSKKGMTLLQYLILKQNVLVPNPVLIEVLWPNEESTNPENALKTLISRFRAILNTCSPGLGSCIAASRGGYRFQLLPRMTVDLFEFEDLAHRLEGQTELTKLTNDYFQQVLTLYTGDLLAGNDQNDWVINRGVALHSQYIKIVYLYLVLLKKAERYEDIIQCCRVALETDPFDERIHLELMQALVKTSRNNEALMQYKHVTNMHFRYLGVKPPEGIQEFYRQIIKAGDTLDMNIDAIREELREYGDVHGAFECEYAVFREIYNMQMRNLERLGSSMYIAMIMITSIDGDPVSPLKLDEVMKGLGEVLREHLRKGDTITRFTPSQYALLLPTVNMDSGHMVLERIKRFFYQRFPNSSVMFSYRIGPLGSGIRITKKKPGSLQVKGVDLHEESE
ncbi:MAG: BTAD domain-containing putative transcriptional regulator [Eubacteriales bacterium]|nr:BTAD domain-containing putative transcriptional regulator [Eubacteriales bacterium]